jgi:hypothetical protein
MQKDKIARRKFIAGTGARLGEMIVPRHQGKWIHYDGEAGKITNVAEANQYLPREYRKGWIL